MPHFPHHNPNQTEGPSGASGLSGTMSGSAPSGAAVAQGAAPATAGSGSAGAVAGGRERFDLERAPGRRRLGFPRLRTGRSHAGQHRHRDHDDA
jgi:hypothetical protein